MGKPARQACSNCGAGRIGPTPFCWWCGYPLSGVAPLPVRLNVEPDPPTPAPAPLPPPTARFSLSTLMVSITVLAVGLAILRVFPSLLLPMILVVSIAHARTVRGVAVLRSHGEIVGMGRKAAVFTASLGVACLVLLIAVLTFLGTGLGAMLGVNWIINTIGGATRSEVGLLVGGVFGSSLGLAFALLAALAVGRRMWP